MTQLPRFRCHVQEQAAQGLSNLALRQTCTGRTARKKREYPKPYTLYKPLETRKEDQAASCLALADGEFGLRPLALAQGHGRLGLEPQRRTSARFSEFLQLSPLPGPETPEA